MQTLKNVRAYQYSLNQFMLVIIYGVEWLTGEEIRIKYELVCRDKEGGF